MAEKNKHGQYVNPGNQGFQLITNSNYVDKTMLIDLLNAKVGTTERLVCVSRPRRFGKSFAAQMLCAYYDCSCDSHALFDDKKIAGCSSYAAHLNQYHVICFDVTSFISVARRNERPLSEVPNMIVDALQKELIEQYKDFRNDMPLTDCILRCVEDSGRKFVFIIDEWDALIREAKNDTATQKKYLDLLREWFKNISFTTKAVAAAYMTGILPIKKDGSQSAISDFDEYTMIKPREFGGYVGFTESEVKSICEKSDVDFEQMKLWYDGYSFKNVGSVYNPNSVMKAARNDDFDSYWTETSAAEGLMEYISQDYNGLTKTIAELIAGIEVPVDTKGFANDLTTFRGKDDVLTLLIHLGYLAYDSEKKIAYIPNEEIRQEFQKSIREVHHSATLKRLQESDALFEATINGDENAVASQIERIHREETSPLHYNKEDSLRSVIKLAYYTYRDHYVQWEELPSGEGYADVAYLPKYDSEYPILLIELKWNKDVQTAIDQINSTVTDDFYKYFGGEDMKGVDVSVHNGDIDWGKVKADGIDFAILRAGYGRLASQKDECFEQNYAGAKAAGIPIGAYWYSYAMTPEEAELEADVFLSVIKGKQFEMPVYFDLEEKKQFDLGKEQVSAIMRAFLKKVESVGYFVGLYGSASSLTTHTADDIKSWYTIWLAHWVDKTNYSGAYGIWQHSEKGKVAGINGNVDLDICYKDFPTIIKGKGLNGWGKAEPTSTPAPDVPDTDVTVTVQIGKDSYKGTLKKE